MLPTCAVETLVGGLDVLDELVLLGQVGLKGGCGGGVLGGEGVDGRVDLSEALFEGRWCVGFEVEVVRLGFDWRLVSIWCSVG